MSLHGLHTEPAQPANSMCASKKKNVVWAAGNRTQVARVKAECANHSAVADYFHGLHFQQVGAGTSVDLCPSLRGKRAHTLPPVDSFSRGDWTVAMGWCLALHHAMPAPVYSEPFHRFSSIVLRAIRQKLSPWPRGPMDKASAHGAGDCRFESCRGHVWMQEALMCALL